MEFYGGKKTPNKIEHNCKIEIKIMHFYTMHMYLMPLGNVQGMQRTTTEVGEKLHKSCFYDRLTRRKPMIVCHSHFSTYNRRKNWTQKTWKHNRDHIHIPVFAHSIFSFNPTVYCPTGLPKLTTWVHVGVHNPNGLSCKVCHLLKW